MSTYEADHNIDSARTSQRPESQRSQPTLTQTIQSFLNSSNSSNGSRNAQVIEALRENLANSELDPEQRESFINLLGDNNNAIFDIFTSIGQSISEDHSPTTQGVDDSFLDTLERVPLKEIKESETCPICTNDYHSDPYPLIVRLPCNDKHFFDLDCIGPWLKLNKTCPLCRTDVTKKKEREILVDSEEEEEGWDMYG